MLFFRSLHLKSAIFSKMAQRFISKYVFVDLEMTGLNPEKNTIMEVACVVTTEQLYPLHSGYSAILHVDEEKLDEMDDWCKKHHGMSGLTDACRNSLLTVEKVEDQLISYIKTHSDPTDLLYLAGNSVYGDRLFLNKYMKRFDKLLHYRIIDVSTIKTLCYGWYPDVTHLTKKLNHRALDDIYESIAELQFYRSTIFR